MKRLPSKLDGPVLIEPLVHGDQRGFFLESYRRNVYAEWGMGEEFVQDNHSRSTRGVLRGMHFQVGDGMSKLVRCVRGSITDVLVDIRRGSPTYGQWEAFELSEDNLREIYCPIGFAHGFCTTSEIADVIYKCSSYYDGSLERGISYNDPAIGIEWPDIELQVSERDAGAPALAEIESELPFTYG